MCDLGRFLICWFASIGLACVVWFILIAREIYKRDK